MGRSLADRIKAAWSSFQIEPEDPIEQELAFADPLRLFNQQSFIKFNPSVLVTRRGLVIYDRMRQDDQVKAALAFKKHAVLSTGWEVVSPEDKPADWEPTVFVRENLENLEGKLSQSLLGVLTALDYGYSVSEKVFEEGDEVRLVAIKSKSPHGIGFDTDAFGNIKPDGIIQQQPLQADPSLTRQTGGFVRLPVNKFVVFQHQKEFGNPYGISDLEAAYRPWWTKDNAYKWLAMMLERYGIPPIFAIYNKKRFTPAAAADLATVLKNMQAATSGTIPRGEDKDDLEMWSPELAGQVSRVFIPALNMFNQDIARAILMPGQLGVAPDVATGSFARAKVIFDVFLFVVEFTRSCIEELVMNEQVIDQLVALNFSTDERPVFKFLPLTDDASSELFKTWTELVTAGSVKPQPEDETHIRNVLGFPARDVENDEDEDEDEDQSGHLDDDEDQSGHDDIPDDLAEFFQTREPTARERKRRTKALAKDLDEAEAVAIEMLIPEIKRQEKFYISKLKDGQLTAQQIRALKPPPTPKLDKTMQRALSTFFAGGAASLKIPKTTKQQDEPIADSLAKTLNFLRNKALVITGVMNDDILADVKNALLMGLKTGEPTRTTAGRIRDAFKPYVGSTGVEGVTTPFRLETIVRTNGTEAFNQGRLAEARTPAGREVVAGMQYSAIIDSRTTEVCRFLDQKIFELDSPELDRLTPPNHFNCRSILVEVLIGEDVSEDDLITASEVGRALDLAQEGFA